MNWMFVTVLVVMVLTAIIIFAINVRERIITLPSTYGHTIDKFHMVVLEWIFHLAIRQGNQLNNLTMIYKMILLESLREYNEDSKYTVGDWSIECMQKAMDEYDIGIGLHVAPDDDTHRPRTHLQVRRQHRFDHIR